MNFIKPVFYTNEYFNSILKKCLNKGNIAVNIAGLIGVPHETQEDINEIYRYCDFLIKNFSNLYNITLSPVIIEPGSPLLNNPEKYKVKCLRKNYHDFRNYTKNVFENNQLDSPVDSFAEYLQYTGIVREGYDEELIYQECFKIQEEITDRAHKNKII